MPKIKQKSIDEISKLYKKNITPEIKSTKVVRTARVVRKQEVGTSGIRPENERRKNLGKKIALGSFAVVFIALLAATFYFYNQWKQIKTDPQVAAQRETTAITEKISRFMDLPAGESPTLATVTSVEKLKDQPFFAHAQNGDKALVYSSAGRAILYRPSTNRIIEVISLTGSVQNSQNPAQPAQQPINQDQAATQQPAAEAPAASAEAPKTVDVVVYNGTSQKGLAKGISTKISQIAETSVVKTDNAKGNYEKTVVVDLSGSNSDLAQKIAETVGGAVGNLPDSETKPNADILIIGGSDFKI